MIKPFLLVGTLILLMAFVLACGGAAEPTTAPTTEAPATAPTNTPAPPPTATEAAMEEEEDSAMTGDVDPALVAAAAERAGGPGAFYIGDLNQLVGPAPGVGLGDEDDMVKLAGLERERYIFDSQY